MYFMGGDQAEAQQRSGNVHDELDLDIVMELHEMFHKYHNYVRIFHYVLDHKTLIKDLKNIIRADKHPRNTMNLS